MKFLVAALAFSQAVSAQFDSPVQPAAVNGYSMQCLIALTNNFNAATRDSCGGFGTGPVSSNTTAEMNAYYDIICNPACSNSIATALKTSGANCTSQEEQVMLKTNEITYKFSIAAQCLKQDGIYCETKHLTALKGTNKTYSLSNPANTELCSPCLRKQIEIQGTLIDQTGALAGQNATEIVAAKKMSTALLDVCPAGTTDIPANVKFTGTNYSSSASRMVVIPGLALIMALLFI